MLSEYGLSNGERKNWLDGTVYNWAKHHGTVLNITSRLAVALGPPCPSLEQSLSCMKHGEVMKILYILRLLSGNLAKLGFFSDYSSHG